MGKNLSVIIPTYNEAKNIEPTARAVLRSLALADISDYELLILDSGSTDGTIEIIRKLKSQNPNIQVTVFSSGYDLGKKYVEGVKMATKQYIAYVPGDDETDHESITKNFQAVESADIILTYTINPIVRSLRRRIISKLYTFILNTLFGMKIKYYNGTCIFPTDAVKKLTLVSTNFSYMSEIVLRLVNSGYHYRELDNKIRDKGNAPSHALGLNGFIDAGKTITKLFWELRVKKFFSK
ncbi:MAG: glycosyltransferase family 2 protein [bacterium]|nr:glycosyltransferase family 2 protein [bacterium]